MEVRLTVILTIKWCWKEGRKEGRSFKRERQEVEKETGEPGSGGGQEGREEDDQLQNKRLKKKTGIGE